MYLFQYLIHLFKHLPVVEPQYGDPQTLQISGSTPVVGQRLRIKMLAAIEFYSQFQLNTIEVQYKGRARMLAAEL
ncbi:hypothetical protein TU85_10900 [Pseudomonas helleri]|nr:hypothetical protein TU85_10900 [Pseudomonas helleri]